MMKNEKIDTYEPKKRFMERARSVFKPAFRVFIVFTIVILTISATRYVLDKKNVEDIVPKSSNQITGNAVYSDYSKALIKKSNSALVQNKDIKEKADYSTIKSDLMNSDMVQDLPKNAVLSLKFYNFNSGVREWEKSFVIRRESVVEGSESGDIQIIIHSKYVRNLKSMSLCSILSLAQSNNDFGADTEMSNGALIWKYKSMMKYRDCLGI